MGGLPGVPAGGLPGVPAGYPPMGYLSPGQPGYGLGHGSPFAPPPANPASLPPASPAFAEMTPLSARPDDAVGPRLPVQPSKLQNLLLFVVVAVSLTAAGIAIWYKMSYRNPVLPVDVATQFKELNLSFEPPPQPWTRDEDTRVKLGPPFMLVYRRENPEAFMAFGARNFDTRSPRPSELEGKLSEIVGRLVERDTLKIILEDQDVEKTWMGQPARSFKFTGQQNSGGAIEGQAFATSFKGIGYWFLAWTGANEIYHEQKDEFAAGRKRCKLLSSRNDWRERQSSVVPFKNNVLGYTLLDPDGIWSEVTDEEQVKAVDPKADKFLVVLADPKKRNPTRKAELVVAVLEPGGDPLQVARDHVTERANVLAELQGQWKFTELSQPPEADPPANTVEGNAPYVMLRCVNERNPAYTRYYVVSAIRAADKVIAVYAWCPWDEKAPFAHQFIQVARSLRSSG